MNHVLKSKLLKDLKSLSKNEMFMDIINECDDDESVNCKSPQNSDKLRDKGNKILAKSSLDNKQRHKVLSLYNESIARAPVESEEMAKTYANKSALLYDMRKYNESIVEADKALKITDLIFLKVKLLCRKAECLTALGSSENRSYLEKARFILSKSEDPPKIREMLTRFIEDTQSVINEGKLDKPRENKRMAEVSKIVQDEEGKDIWKSVDIKFTSKYGKHFVAARDFQPGETILIEKPYLYHLRETRIYQYCCKCFNYLWTAVPCDHCCWRMFCSEECKNEAWNEYHDLECSVMSQMKFALCCQWHEIISSLLCIFFKALKEAGSINQLVADFKSSGCGDQCDKDLDHKTIFASPSADVRNKEFGVLIDRAAVALVGLAKFTNILEKRYNFNEIGKLMKNKAAITIGCLLLKLSAAIITGGVSPKLIDPTLQDGSYQEKEQEIQNGEDPNCRSIVFNVATMLTVQGCIPNVHSCRTAGHKSLLYATIPIKAGTPLFLYNLEHSVYHGTPKHERQLNHQALYKCPCDCLACTENWHDDLAKANEFMLNPQGIDLEGVTKFLEEYKSIMTECGTQMTVHKPNYPDLKTVTRVHKCAREGWKYFPVPSSLMKTCTDMLTSFTFSFHNPNKNLFTTS